MEKNPKSNNDFLLVLKSLKSNPNPFRNTIAMGPFMRSHPKYYEIPSRYYEISSQYYEISSHLLCFIIPNIMRSHPK